MSQLKFLCDECVSHDIVDYLRRVEPKIDILAVNEKGAPPKHTPDPDVLAAALAQERTLVSGDLGTMLTTVSDSLAAGKHNFGAIFLKPWYAVARYGADLHLIWYCETNDDWLDRCTRGLSHLA